MKRADDTGYPVVQARVRLALSHHYIDNYRGQNANKVLEEALIFAEKTQDHAVISEILGQLLFVQVYLMGEPLEHGEELLRHALSHVKANPTPQAITQWNHAAGTLAYRSHRFLDAARYFRQQFEATYDIAGSETGNAATALSNHAFSLLSAGKIDRAEGPLRQAFRSIAAIYGPHHSRLLLAGTNLGIVLYRNGQFKESLRLLERLRKITDRLKGSSLEIAAHPLEFYFGVTLGCNDAQEAYAIAQRIEEIATDPSVKRVNPDFARASVAVAAALRGDWDEVNNIETEILNRDLQARFTGVGIDSLNVTDQLALSLGKFELAHRRIASISVEDAEQNPFVDSALSEMKSDALGQLWLATGNWDLAILFLKAEVDRVEPGSGYLGRPLALRRIDLARAYLLAGHPDLAAPQLDVAEAAIRRELSDDHPLLSRLMLLQVERFWLEGRAHDARALWENIDERFNQESWPGAVIDRARAAALRILLNKDASANPCTRDREAWGLFEELFAAAGPIAAAERARWIERFWPSCAAEKVQANVELHFPDGLGE